MEEGACLWLQCLEALVADQEAVEIVVDLADSAVEASVGAVLVAVGKPNYY